MDKVGKTQSKKKSKRTIKKLSIIDLILICYFNWTYKDSKKKETVDFPMHEYVKWVRESEEWYRVVVALMQAVKKCKTLAEVKKLKVSPLLPRNVRRRCEQILEKCKSLKSVYGELKRKLAVQVYPSCTFDKKGCTRANVKGVTGIMVYDLQGISMKAVNRLKKWCHTIALHKSIGGSDGDYALFVHCSGLTVDNYKGTWENVNQLIQEKFDISPDSSDHTNEVNRVRYLSYDPEIYYNPRAKSIKASPDSISTQQAAKPKATQSQITAHTKEDVEKVVRKIERRKIDIMPDYETFLKMGYALATLGEVGLGYYLRLSKFYNGEQKRSPEEQFEICLKGKLPKGSKAITIATFFHLAAEHGFKLPETRRKQLRKEQHILQNNSDGTTDWILKHVYLTPSVKSDNKLAHVLVDENNVCHYFESKASEKASSLLRMKIADILKLDRWPEIHNEGFFPKKEDMSEAEKRQAAKGEVISIPPLARFDESRIQKDTANTIYLYYLNGTLKITKRGAVFLSGKNRPWIWDSLVLKRNYKPTNKIHEMAALAQKCVLDYKLLQIALGFLLHRCWFREATKMVWAYDVNPTSRHDGRRGKDMFTKILEMMRPFVSPKWKAGHNFWTSCIGKDTAIIHFEDCPDFLINDEEIKKAITGNLTIEHKGENVHVVDFANKPKMSASCQRSPQDYENRSNRGRVLAIGFNTYLQENPPKKTLVYNDEDLAPFDNWMIQCCQVYLSNIDKLKGIPELTEDQRKEALRATYGNTIIRAVGKAQVELLKDGFLPSEKVTLWLDCPPTDSKKIGRFKECYTKEYTGYFLSKVKRDSGEKDEKGNRIFVHGYVQEKAE